MKFLILGDLHGSLPKIHFKQFDAIIAPGDFCTFEGRKILFKHGKDKPWYEFIGKKKAKAMIERDVKTGRRVLEKLNSRGVPVFIVPGNIDNYGSTGLTKAQYKWKYVRKNRYKEIIRGLSNIKDCHFKTRDFNGMAIIGYGLSSWTDYPVYSKRKTASTGRR